MNFFVKERELLLNIFFAIAIFVLSLTPLILFDYKHKFVNAKSFASILTEKESFDLERKAGRQGFVAISKFVTLDLKDRASQVMFEASFAVNSINHPLLFVVIIASILYLIRRKGKLEKSELVLLAYLLPAIVGISLYQHQVYAHYIAYLFPLVYISYGLFFAKLPNEWLMLALLTPFSIYFLVNNFDRYTLQSNSWTIDDMRRTSDEIYKRVNPNEKYNLVLFAESKDLYGMNYRYFLNTKDNPPVDMEELYLAKKLFVINEEKIVQDVRKSPIYEIVVFPKKNVQEVFSMENGPEITVLTSYNNPALK